MRHRGEVSPVGLAVLVMTPVSNGSDVTLVPSAGVVNDDAGAVTSVPVTK